MIDYAQKYEDQLADEMETATRKGIEKGIKKGLLKGRKEGRNEKLESARRMKERNFSIADIADIQGLSIDDVEKL
jgi:predicted transposase/invertase (TIGR01784 family)